MNIVAVILARGGSKGLPGKNIMPMAGKPLVGYAINHALKAALVDRVIVSTDSKSIASVARRHGAETPFIRPAHLAADDTPMFDCLKHCVKWLSDNEGYETDIVVLLKTTIPFREDGIIDRVVRRVIEDPSLDTCFAGYPTVKKYWRKQNGQWNQLASDINPGLGRQDREPLYQEDHGIACATRSRVILGTDHYVGKNVDIVEYEDKRSHIDIDDLYDFWMAEQVAKEWNPYKDFPKEMLEDRVLYGGLE